MQKQAVLKIYGRVQGVFFRDSTKTKARELYLSGFVRNEEDGTVLVAAEGEENNLKEFIKWCEDGPNNAKVERVDTKWLPATGDFNGFIIKD